MPTLRAIATPLTIGAFALMGVTGLLMFFHLETGLNKAAHEWLGWALLAGAGAHLAVNWRPFRSHLKRRPALWIIGAFAAVLALSFAPVGGEGGGAPTRAALSALIDAPLTAVAGVTGEAPAALVARLTAAGYAAAPDLSIADLTKAAPDARMDLLRAALTPGA